MEREGPDWLVEVSDRSSETRSSHRFTALLDEEPNMSPPPQYRSRPYDTSEPGNINVILNELFQQRGYLRFDSNQQLQAIWDELTAEFATSKMQVKSLKNGVFEVNISNSALLYQLNSYYKNEILQTLQTHHKHLKVRDIKFRLKGSLNE